MTDWRDQALCRNQDPELFFPISDAGLALAQIERAKAVCRRCPVLQACLNWALSTGHDTGIWGGLTGEERRVLRHRQAASEARPGNRLRGGTRFIAKGDTHDRP